MNNDRKLKDDSNYQTLDNGEALVIVVPKSLNASEAISFRKAFKPICESEILPSEVTLDFSKTSFLDSSGIGALASIIKTSKIAGIDLRVVGVTPQVYSVLKMTKLDQLLSIETSEVISSKAALGEPYEPAQTVAFVC